MLKDIGISDESTSIRIGLPSKRKGLCTLLSITDEKGKLVGRLDVRNRTVIFHGKCDEAAKAFFQASKSFIETYIRESLMPKPEEVKEDMSQVARALRKLGLKKSDVLASNVRDGRVVIVTQNGKKLIV